MQKIFSGYTNYQLLIFLLLKNKKDQVIFILPKYLERLSIILGKKYKVYTYYQEKPRLKNIIQFLNYYYNLLKLKKKLIKEVKFNSSFELYGDMEINYILEKGNAICRLEDGIGNYTTEFYEDRNTLKKATYFYIERVLWFVFFKKRLLDQKEKIEKRINRYYATNMASPNLKFEFKTERIDLKELWRLKTEEEKKEILEIFNVNADSLKNLKNRKIIIFTQPLSEDSIISEKEKIELYSKVLSKYKEEELIIKPHPRERTRYSEYFKKCLVIEGNFPSELLYFNGIEITKVVTLFSTAALTFGKNVEIDFYGTELNEKLYKKFGSCDSIMKRNAFL